MVTMQTEPLPQQRRVMLETCLLADGVTTPAELARRVNNFLVENGGEAITENRVRSWLAGAVPAERQYERALAAALPSLDVGAFGALC